MKNTNVNLNIEDIISVEDMDPLKIQMVEMQMEIDIKKETVNMLRNQGED